MPLFIGYVGAVVAEPLYSGSLGGADGLAGSYTGMFKVNLRRIMRGLQEDKR